MKSHLRGDFWFRPIAAGRKFPTHSHTIYDHCVRAWCYSKANDVGDFLGQRAFSVAFKLLRNRVIQQTRPAPAVVPSIEPYKTVRYSILEWHCETGQHTGRRQNKKNKSTRSLLSPPLCTILKAFTHPTPT